MTELYKLSAKPFNFVLLSIKSCLNQFCDPILFIMNTDRCFTCAHKTNPQISKYFSGALCTLCIYTEVCYKSIIVSFRLYE